jgi:hypothetical protein
VLLLPPLPLLLLRIMVGVVVVVVDVVLVLVVVVAGTGDGLCAVVVGLVVAAGGGRLDSTLTAGLMEEGWKAVGAATVGLRAWINMGTSRSASL